MADARKKNQTKNQTQAQLPVRFDLSIVAKEVCLRGHGTA
jgi:hypothetical protein